MAKRATSKVDSGIARGIVVEGFKRLGQKLRTAEDAAELSDSMRAFSRNAGLEDTYIQRIIEGAADGHSFANVMAVVHSLGMTEDDAVGVKPVEPFGSLRGLRLHGGARRRITPSPAESIKRNFPQLTNDNNVGKSKKVRNEIEFQPVVEYIIGTPTTNQDPAKMVPIREMPVQAERLISTDLLAKMKPDAEPVIVQISGDSMAPTFPAGSHLLVDASINAAWQPGAYVLFDGTHYIQRCIRIPGTTPPMVRVLSDNDRYPSFDVAMSSLNVCGLVIAMLDPETWDEKTA